MKKLLYLSLAALMVLAVSCGKDNKPGNDDPGKYGVDGKTPMPEAVDIGLVVNGKTIKWASFNLGASKEYEYGDYYAWGETEPKTEYLPTNYKHANVRDNDMLFTAYCPKDNTVFWDYTAKPEGPDGISQRLPSDDAAHVKLGGKWRIPTNDELDALMDLENDKEHYELERWAAMNVGGKEVHGLRITQKSTGNSIFFPAAGSRPNPLGTTEIGKYWSSSLDTTFPIAAGSLGFNSWTWEKGGHRYVGHSIRPVWEE